MSGIHTSHLTPVQIAQTCKMCAKRSCLPITAVTVTISLLIIAVEVFTSRHEAGPGMAALRRGGVPGATTGWSLWHDAHTGIPPRYGHIAATLTDDAGAAWLVTALGYAVRETPLWYEDVWACSLGQPSSACKQVPLAQSEPHLKPASRYGAAWCAWDESTALVVGGDLGSMHTADTTRTYHPGTHAKDAWTLQLQGGQAVWRQIEWTSPPSWPAFTLGAAVPVPKPGAASSALGVILGSGETISGIAQMQFWWLQPGSDSPLWQSAPLAGPAHAPPPRFGYSMAWISRPELARARSTVAGQLILVAGRLLHCNTARVGLGCYPRTIEMAQVAWHDAAGMPRIEAWQTITAADAGVPASTLVLESAAIVSQVHAKLLLFGGMACVQGCTSSASALTVAVHGNHSATVQSVSIASGSRSGASTQLQDVGLVPPLAARSQHSSRVRDPTYTIAAGAPLGRHRAAASSMLPLCSLPDAQPAGSICRQGLLTAGESYNPYLYLQDVWHVQYME